MLISDYSKAQFNKITDNTSNELNNICKFSQTWRRNEKEREKTRKTWKGMKYNVKNE